MGRKHKHPEHENLERWLVSYADFITLLFATFVVLYALGQLDLAKLKELSGSLKQAFSPSADQPAAGIMGQTSGVMPGSPAPSFMDSSGNSILDKTMPSPADIALPKEPGMAGLNQSVKEINDAKAKTEKPVAPKDDPHAKQTNPEKSDASGAGDEAGKGMGGEGDQPEIELIAQDRGILIRMTDSLFFEPGAAGLKPASFKALDKLAVSLKANKRLIQVEGHTDAQGIASAIYPSNWELSGARASSVVRYLSTRHGIPVRRLSAMGYGSSRPVASNATPAGRAKNRRVDILLMDPIVAKFADPKTPKGVTGDVEPHASTHHSSHKASTKPSTHATPAPHAAHHVTHASKPQSSHAEIAHSKQDPHAIHVRHASTAKTPPKDNSSHSTEATHAQHGVKKAHRIDMGHDKKPHETASKASHVKEVSQASPH